MASLAKYTSCDLSDSLQKHGHKDGGFIPNLAIQSPVVGSVSASGPAYTVLYAAKSDPRSAVPQSYIDEVPKDSIVVIGLTLDLQLTGAPYTKVNNAMYGGLMSTRAQYRGAKGSVVLGRIRDVDEHNDLEFPVWSYGVGTSAPGPALKVIGINVPIQVKVQGIEKEEVIVINPGDYVVGDKNGVVRVADDGDLQSILEYIPKRVEADENVAKDIKKGKGATELQKLWRGSIN